MPDEIELFDFLLSHYNDGELREIAARFKINDEDVASRRVERRQFALAFVQYLQRRGQLDHLRNYLRIDREEAYEKAFDAGKITLADLPPVPPGLPDSDRRIFISHATADADFARKLARDLEKRGWPTWISPRDIGSELWVPALGRALQSSRHFLLVLTPDALRSAWVEWEIAIAIARERRGEMGFHVAAKAPIAVPAYLSSYQYTPFMTDYAAGLNTLLSRL